MGNLWSRRDLRLVTQEQLKPLKSRRDDILVLMVAAASNKRGVFHIGNLVYRPYGTIDLGWLLVTNIPSLTGLCWLTRNMRVKFNQSNIINV